MRRFIPFIILAYLLAGIQAHAYTRARVYIHSSVDSDTTEGPVLQQTLLGRLGKQLVRHYTCLDIMDSIGLQESLEFIRKQQLVGTNETTIDTEMSNVLGLMDMRYLIIANVTAMKDRNFYKLNIIAKNKKKADFPFYNDSYIFRSFDAALAAIDGAVEALVNGFTKYLSEERERVGGEICAVKGPVTVVVETERLQDPPENTLYKYCNGGDQLWKKSSFLKATSKETWKLERYGIPDTRGTMEGSSYEETAVEEIDGCHECSTGNRQTWWRYSKKTEATRSVSGLSDKSGADGFPAKDATVRLHFQNDGTYDVTVAATSLKGKMLSSSNISAEGSCDVEHKKQTGFSSTFTIPMQYTFKGFAGTPYDTTLKGTKTLKFENKERGEKINVTIDFDLSRPTINK